MKTRQELILDFMLALASNSDIMRMLEDTGDLVVAAESLADAYLKTLG